MGRKIIIGIHGLDNKPTLDVLEGWWKDAIIEGLSRHAAGLRSKVRFELVYWADLMYPEPMELGTLADPYTQAEGDGPLPRVGLSVRKVTSARLRGSMGKALEKVSLARLGQRVVQGTVESKMPDLHFYNHDGLLREAIQARLIKRLRSARRWRRKVMLIAHSMGSIVAYDVLRNAERTLRGLEVAHFVTVGSPLGLSDLKTVFGGPRFVPECVACWSNFSDPKDPVSSWDTSLFDNYQPNSRGVTISDHLVVNSYVSPSGKPNAHKVYGYLRTPEMSELIGGFLR